jgi:hypothetical protein
MDKEKIALTYYLARSFHYVEVRFGRMNRLCKKKRGRYEISGGKDKEFSYRYGNHFGFSYGRNCSGDSRSQYEIPLLILENKAEGIE